MVFWILSVLFTNSRNEWSGAFVQRKGRGSESKCTLWRAISCARQIQTKLTLQPAAILKPEVTRRENMHFVVTVSTSENCPNAEAPEDEGVDGSRNPSLDLDDHRLVVMPLILHFAAIRPATELALLLTTGSLCTQLIS